MKLIVAVWLSSSDQYHKYAEEYWPHVVRLIDADLEEAVRLLEEPNAGVYNVLRDVRWVFEDGTELA